MKHYVSTRTQVTTVNNHTSSLRNVECGTAQGSILRPLLHIIYVNDVLNVLENENDVYLYADAMLIMSKNSNEHQMMLNLQNKMDKIYGVC